MATVNDPIRQELHKFITADLGITYNKFERIYGFGHDTIRRIVRDNKPITHRTAYLLAKISGVEMGFWLDC